MVKTTNKNKQLRAFKLGRHVNQLPIRCWIILMQLVKLLLGCLLLLSTIAVIPCPSHPFSIRHLWSDIHTDNKKRKVQLQIRPITSVLCVFFVLSHLVCLSTVVDWLTVYHHSSHSRYCALTVVINTTIIITSIDIVWLLRRHYWLLAAVVFR